MLEIYQTDLCRQVDKGLFVFLIVNICYLRIEL